MAVTSEGEIGGAGRIRTDDVLLAKQVLYQLSYDPKWSSDVSFKERYSQNLLCAINQDPEACASFDHRRDHLRDVAVSLERR
jgi:hypothetical protein